MGKTSVRFSLIAFTLVFGLGSFCMALYLDVLHGVALENNQNEKLLMNHPKDFQFGFTTVTASLIVMMGVLGVKWRRIVRAGHILSRQQVMEIESRALYAHSIVSQLHIGVVLTDLHDVVLSINPAGRTALGLHTDGTKVTFAELIGIDPKVHRSRIKSATENNLKGECLDLGVYRLRHGSTALEKFIHVSISVFNNDLKGT